MSLYMHRYISFRTRIVLEFIYNTLSVCSEKDFRMALVIKFPFFVLAQFSG